MKRDRVRSRTTLDTCTSVAPSHFISLHPAKSRRTSESDYVRAASWPRGFGRTSTADRTWMLSRSDPQVSSCPLSEGAARYLRYHPKPGGFLFVRGLMNMAAGLVIR